MHVLRKLTGCLSSTTCDNDENHQQEATTSSIISILSQSSIIQDREPIENETDHSRDSRHSIMISEG